ncbi:ATP-dependent Clp protease proteolytic subunit 3, chloroplastic [Tanacetum coccineum]
MTLYSTPPSLLYPKNPLSSNTHFIHKNTRPSLSIKASSSSSSKSLNNNNTTTLSSNWDVVGPTSAAPAWMPRFEELDTTNMLLRQRIVFLGSQIVYALAGGLLGSSVSTLWFCVG